LERARLRGLDHIYKGYAHAMVCELEGVLARFAA